MPLKYVCDYGPCGTDLKDGEAFQVQDGEVDARNGIAEQGEFHGLFCSPEHVVMYIAENCGIYLPEMVEDDADSEEPEPSPPTAATAAIDPADESPGREDGGDLAPDDEESDVPPEVAEDLDTAGPEEPDADVQEDREEDDEEPGGEHVCDDCDETFETAQALGSHAQHCGEGERPAAVRIREKIQGEGWMDSGEIVEVADLNDKKQFLNAKKNLDDLEERPHQDPDAHHRAKQYRIPADDQEQEEEAESELDRLEQSVQEAARGEGESDEAEIREQVAERRDEPDEPGVEKARRVEDAMAGQGWMTSTEATELAELESEQEFHNIRHTDTRLDELIESKVDPGADTGMVFRIPTTGEDGEAAAEDDADTDASPSADTATPEEPGESETDDEEEIESQRQQDLKLRSDEGTILDVREASISGRYLCCDDGKSFATADAARRHESKEHLPGDETVRRLQDDGREDELEKRWILAYNGIGSDYVHPKEHEGKKKRIERALDEAEYFLDEAQLRDATGFSTEELHDLLEELVEEDRVEQDQETWGVEQ